jgi:predicted aminopeptidase
MLLHARLLPAAARLALLLLLAPLGGCYYLHVTAGQMDLNARRVPIEDVLADPASPEALRARLAYVVEVRRFASGALGLPDNGSYASYAELDRANVVWNVFAAPEFSVEPKRWCFPVAGCVSYRGYFAEDKARRAAERLRRRGFDVHVGPVAAYSTLGHFEDPVLSSMLRYDEVSLAALLFHELAHQVAYAPGDSDFSEAFATVVEFEGTRRWLEARGRLGELEGYLESRRRFFAVADLMVAARAGLAGIYASGLSQAQMREAKARAIERLRADYRALRDGWAPGGAAMDGLLEGEVNNARLGAISTYQRCVPGLRARLAALDGALAAFYALGRRLAAGPAGPRRGACGGAPG